MTRRKDDALEAMRLQVKKLILKAYPTVERFCWETGLNKATVSNFLRGKKDFQVSTLVKIGHALDRQLVIRLAPRSR